MGPTTLLPLRRKEGSRDYLKQKFVQIIYSKVCEWCTPWRRQTLSRRYSFSRYARKYNYTRPKKNMTIPAPILTQLTNSQRHLLYQIWPKSDNKCGGYEYNSFTPVSKLWLSLRRFLRNSHSAQYLYRISYKAGDNYRKYGEKFVYALK